MSSDFSNPSSNPSWFPAPPLKPPKPISTRTIILGTVVPIVAIAVAAVLILTQGSAKPNAATRSMAAFSACLKAKIEASPGQSPNPTELQQEANACGSHLPAGVRVPDFTQSQRPSNSAQQAFNQCMQAALANVRPGRIGGINRQAFENASAMCRALIARGGSSTTPLTTTSGPPTA